MVAGKTYRVACGDETRLVHMAENRENVDSTRVRTVFNSQFSEAQIHTPGPTA